MCCMIYSLCRCVYTSVGVTCWRRVHSLECNLGTLNAILLLSPVCYNNDVYDTISPSLRLNRFFSNVCLVSVIPANDLLTTLELIYDSRDD